MADPMRIRAQTKDGMTEVRVLMAHIMETGQRKDSAGNVIPAHYIEDVTATVGDKTVLSAKWGPAVSQNPFLHFKFKGAKPGDKLKVTWKDNKGESRVDEVTLS
jgi:sulfur-oxidizing protein SoxZ